MSAVQVSPNASWVGWADGAPVSLLMALFVPAAGWLLDLQHLTLGAQIGEGEFGGEEGTQQAVLRTDPSSGQCRTGVGCLRCTCTHTSWDPLLRKPSVCILLGLGSEDSRLHACLCHTSLVHPKQLEIMQIWAAPVGFLMERDLDSE